MHCASLNLVRWKCPGSIWIDLRTCVRHFPLSLTPDISPHCAGWFEGRLTVKPFINPERVWAPNTRRYDGAVISNPRVGAITTVVDRLVMHEWLGIPGRNASTPA